MHAYWRLLPHATACIAAGKVILLDVRQDRYYAVPTAIGEAARTWLEAGDGGRPPDAFASLLVKAGIVAHGDAAPSNVDQQIARLPMQLASDDRHVRTAWRDAVAVSVLVGTMRLRIRMLPLRYLLARHARRTEGPGAGGLVKRAARYERARRLIPIARNCLLDSLTLDHWLGAQGSGRRLIFGVTAEPFAAHCWVQSEDRILNDSYDRVSRFAPILVV